MNWGSAACLGGGGVESLAFGEDVVGDAAEFADEAEPGEDFEGVEGEIDLPPIKTLAGGGHEGVMIVLPAFAEGDQGEQPVVFAGVGGWGTAIAGNGRKGIDSERTVPEGEGAEDKGPDLERPGTQER